MVHEGGKNGDEHQESQAGLSAMIGLGLLAFLIFASYAIARPTLKSLLITHYSKDALPIAWLLVGAVVTLTVMIYGRFAATVPLNRLYQRVVLICCVTLGLTMLLYRSGATWSVFLLFVWKDVYIVVLAEMFWSLANGLFQLKKAKWVYGIFCALGSLGGMTANFAVGPVATELGTEHTPWLVIPVLLASAAVVMLLPRFEAQSPTAQETVDYVAGFRVVRASRYLVPLLTIIALIQVAITLVDYQCSGLVEAQFASPEERTAVFGQIYGAIDIAALILQLCSGVILTALGVGGTLLGVPLILFVFLGGFLAAPTFVIMALAMVAGKSMDYSVYRAAKELLYLPLSHHERTQGKAVIDMMTYRVAKGVASVTILGLAAVAAPTWTLTVISILLVAAWAGLTWYLVPRYAEENRAQGSGESEWGLLSGRKDS